MWETELETRAAVQVNAYYCCDANGIHHQRRMGYLCQKLPACFDLRKIYILSYEFYTAVTPCSYPVIEHFLVLPALLEILLLKCCQSGGRTQLQKSDQAYEEGVACNSKTTQQR